MGKILFLLKEYLAPIFTSPDYGFKNVLIGNPKQIAQTIANGTVPVIVIEPGRQNTRTGFSGDSIYRVDNVTIRAIYATNNIDAFRDPTKPYSLTNIADELRTWLAKNKTLGTINDSFRYQSDVPGDVIEVSSSRHTEIWLRCSYAHAEQWDGAFNDQDSLAPIQSA